MEVDVCGTIPVVVTVDIETGEVVEVHAVDEAFEWDKRQTGAHWTQLRKAQRLADDADWPAWEWGY